MTFGPILSILGLASYLQDAETIVNVSKDTYEAIKDAKAMLDGPEGQKFKAAIRKAIDDAEDDIKNKVSDVTHPTIQYAAGSYQWDGFEGWVWVPKGAEQ